MDSRFHRPVLGIALVRGMLHARVLRGGKAVASWDAPDPVAGIDGFREILEEVPERTGFSGSSVVVVFASSQMEHQLVRIPPMRERDLESFLSRKVRTEAAQKGRQAWSWHVLHEGKGERQVALHLIPLELVHVVLDFCRGRDYQAEQVVPLASALGWSARGLPMEPGKWALVVADQGSASTIVAADPGGRLAMVRELAYGFSDPDSAERLPKELHRSILFAKQQFGIAIDGIWISGAEDGGRTPDLPQAIADVPVRPLDSADPPTTWLAPLADLDPDVHDNMVPRPLRRLKSRRRRLEISFFVIALLHAVLFATFVRMERIATSLEHQIQAAGIHRRLADLQQEKLQLSDRLAEIHSLQATAVRLRTGRWDPKPGWLLLWVGGHLPRPLRLDQVLIEKIPDSGAWTASFHGFTPREAVHAARALETFQKDLVQGTPRLSLTRPWQEQWMDNLRTGATWDIDSAGKPFRIEGRLQ